MGRRIPLIVVGAALLVILAGCAQKEQQSQVKETAEKVQVATERVTDPVCGMQVDAETAVMAAYQGDAYHFCSADCQEQFLQNPAKYISTENGIDPVCGMKVDPKTAIKGEYEGKTYQFCSAECHDTFMKDPGKYMSSEGHHMEDKGHEGHGH